MKSKSLLLILISSIALTISISTYCFAENIKLTLLHTNDQHGHFQKFNNGSGKDIGGLAAQSTLINIIRAEVKKDKGSVLLLSAGDINTGVPASDLLNAKPDIKLMNLLGYDAMVLGNHEFDNPPAILNQQINWAKFPFLAANILHKESEKHLVRPYIIKEVNGLKIGIIGFITDQTPNLVFAKHIDHLEFKPVIETARKYIPIVKAQSDIVIALTHLGIYDDSAKIVGDRQLAEAVEGIDIIVGGHTHTNLYQPITVGKTVILQAGSYSEKLGRLDLEIDNTSKMILRSSYKLIPVNTRNNDIQSPFPLTADSYTEDTNILAVEQPFIESVKPLLDKPIAKTSAELNGNNSINRFKETNLGDLITDAMRAKTGADIAFQNGGGIRASIAAGKIAYADILSVSPYNNSLVVIDMTGQQITQLL
ncbi:MAG: 5'-nucleotidase C-terminal domain-containing protein, partial [Desulfotalea sp.]